MIAYAYAVSGPVRVAVAHADCGDYPSAQVFAGCALVVVAGLFLVYLLARLLTSFADDDLPGRYAHARGELSRALDQVEHLKEELAKLKTAPTEEVKDLQVKLGRSQNEVYRLRQVIHRLQFQANAALGNKEVKKPEA